MNLSDAAIPEEKRLYAVGTRFTGVAERIRRPEERAQLALAA